MSRIIEIPNLDDLLRLYQAGESEQKLSSEFGVGRTSAAHDAARGRKATVAEREQRARTVEAKGIGASQAERILADMLREKGVAQITSQKAVGIYNIDLAIKAPRIAIEISGGNWHNTAKHIRLHHQRIPYIRNAGWSVVIIRVDALNYPLTVVAADYVVALSERLRLQKPKRGEYHVIRGNGEPVSILSSQFNCIPVVESPTSRDNMGRFHSNVRQ